MMRPLSLALVPALVGALAASGQAAPAGKTIRVTAVQVDHRARTRNVFVEGDELYSGGARVGYDLLSCTVISRTRISCVGLVSVGRDTLTARFVTPVKAQFGTGTLDGGRGTNRGATGTFTWKNLDPQGKRTRLTLKFG
jgi:hypothetical protein